MKQLSSSVWVILVSIAGLLLLSMIAFPLGFDQAIFEVGGALIAKTGAVPYRDFLELKQPLIFYIYSLSTVLFGRHESSIRILDIFYQLVALTVFYRMLRTVYADQRIAITSVVLYALYYSGTGFWMTAEPESFSLLPQVVLLWMLLKVESEKKNIILFSFISIACIWIVVSMKVTLGLIGGIIPLYALFSLSENRKKYLLWCSIFTIAFAVGTVGLLWLIDGLDNMVLTFRWLSQYASYYPIFSIETYREFYSKIFIWQLVVVYSPMYLLLAIIAIIRSPLSVWWQNNEFSKRAVFRGLCFFAFLINIIAVCLERKGFNYHFTRAAWCLVPFAAETIIDMVSFVRQQWYRYSQSRASYRRFIFSTGCIAITVIIILLSPVPRIIDQSIGWSMIGIRQDTTARDSKIDQSNYDVSEMKSIVVKYGPLLNATDNIFVWGNSAQLYYFFNRVPTTIVLVNALFVTTNTPMKWTMQLLQQLQAAPPKLFICEYHDERPLITGTTEDSFMSLQRNPVFAEFLSSTYSVSDSTNHFKIYLRKGN